MKRLFFVLPLLAATTLANPSGRRWALNTCTTTCTRATAQCVSGRCLPEVRFAASVANTGGMTINGPSAVPYATALASMRSAFETWTTPNVTTCSTSMDFSFQGNFASPSGTAAISGSDGNNNVIWLGGTSWRYGSGTLGLATTTFSSGLLLDADMELNNNSRWGTTGAAGDTDLQSVVTHEAGHFIGFSHSTSGNAVMNPSIGSGVIKRALLAPDLSDICGVYPGVTGGQGSPCTTGANCTGGTVCEGGVGASSLLCTQDCTGTESCPAGYSCQPSTAGFACLPQVGVPDQCRFCVSGADCSSGVCITGNSGRNYCSDACTVGQADQCALGSSCVDNGGGAFCAPNTACTNQCTPATAATECGPGYACAGGTCTPTGGLGDRCEVSEFCQPCTVCTLDPNNLNRAYCRACCNGAAQCAGCTATTCAAVAGNPAMCLPHDAGTETLCFPFQGADVCEACVTSATCSGGRPCVGGLCRPSCDLANPGTCPACFPSGAGGVCVCNAAELSGPNEPCVVGTTTVSVCQTGLRCLSGLCRVPCTMGVPNTCSVGFDCVELASQTVCIPAVDAGPMGGGGGGGGGGTASGGGGPTEPCGPATCGGCCQLGQCVQQTTDEACGTFGGTCNACKDTESCQLGACVVEVKKGCSCSEVEGISAVLLALGMLRRRRRLG